MAIAIQAMWQAVRSCTSVVLQHSHAAWARSHASKVGEGGGDRLEAACHEVCCTCCIQLSHCPLSLPTSPPHPRRRAQPLTGHCSAPLTPRTCTDCGTWYATFDRWLRTGHLEAACHEVLHALQTASPLPSLAAYTPTPPQTNGTTIDWSL